MKRLFLSIIAAIIGVIGMMAQDYNISMAGLASDGAYYVKVTTILDKKQNKTALDYVKRMAVDGVMFRGIASGPGYSSQRPLISDIDVAQTKKEFFEAFNREGLYANFCTIEPSNVVVTQLPKKRYEVTALVTVDKERLLEYLTEHGIISNFNSLW